MNHDHDALQLDVLLEQQKKIVNDINIDNININNNNNNNYYCNCNKG